MIILIIITIIIRYLAGNEASDTTLCSVTIGIAAEDPVALLKQIIIIMYIIVIVNNTTDNTNNNNNNN